MKTVAFPFRIYPESSLFLPPPQLPSWSSHPHLAWIATIVSSLDPHLHSRPAFPTPQFLLRSSSHLIPHKPESDHTLLQLRTFQWLPISSRIKSKVLAMASQPLFVFPDPPPISLFSPSPISFLYPYLFLPHLLAWIRPGTPLPQAFSLAAPPSRNVLHTSYCQLPHLFSLHSSLFLSEANSDPSYLNFSAPHPLLISHSLFYCSSTTLITKGIIYYFLCLLSRMFLCIDTSSTKKSIWNRVDPE